MKTTVPLFFLLFIFSSCVKHQSAENTAGFPKNIAAIINTRCAVAGCHTDNSEEASGGLSFSSWNTMFLGGFGGSVVIPYRHDQSWVCYFTNVDSSLGIVLTPTMPDNKNPLSKADYLSIEQWIDNGAKDEAGDVAFSGDPKRDKFYVVNQACGEVTVFDASSKLAMRYIHVNDAENSLPHSVVVSPDGQYWYVIFYDGTVIKKYSTLDDSYVGSINLLQNSLWSTLVFNNGSSNAFVIGFTGVVEYVDLDNGESLATYQQQGGQPLFDSPHGAAINKKTLYVTSQGISNELYKINITNPLKPVIKTIKIDSAYKDTLGIHVIDFTPDSLKYFITCQTVNKVFEYQASNDSLIKAFDVGTYPQEIAFSTTTPYVFITCEEDANSGYKCKGSVEIINYKTNELMPSKLLDGLYQPHGIAVDDKHGIVIVASLNWDGSGPAPHHQSTCGGSNGFVQVITLNKLQFDPNYRTEVSVFPYFVSVRN